MSDPERIYLQQEEFSSTDLGGQTWCIDRIDESDTEYVRADLFATLEAENKELQQKVVATDRHFEQHSLLTDREWKEIRVTREANK